jgi:hypothetical protein
VCATAAPARPVDPGCRVAGEQFVPQRRLKFAMASMGKPDTKVSELCKELGISRQTRYRHVSPNGPARPDGVRVLSRKLRRCETGDVSVDAPVAVNAAGGAYGN